VNAPVSYNEDHDNAFNRGIDIIISILASGNSVELPAKGFSMFPVFRPGYKIMVKPVIRGELLIPGSVIVLDDEGVLVMHRLVNIIYTDSGEIFFITRGDSAKVTDKPWSQQRLVGLAVSYKDPMKEHPVKTFIPSSWRYGYNRRLLWLFNKITKLKMIFSIFNLNHIKV
jgi:hypothetical protein